MAPILAKEALLYAKEGDLENAEALAIRATRCDGYPVVGMLGRSSFMVTHDCSSTVRIESRDWLSVRNCSHPALRTVTTS